MRDIYQLRVSRSCTELQVEDLLSGRIGDRDTSAHLLEDDAMLIAEDRIASARKYPIGHNYRGPEYAVAVQWLEAGYR